MKKFCEPLREHILKIIINFEKKNLMPLTDKEYELYLNQTVIFAKTVRTSVH